MTTSRKASKRRTVRRLAIVLGSVLALGGLAGALQAVNAVQRGRLAREARAEGLAAFAAGEYTTAVDRLGFSHSRTPGDTEVTLALAEALIGRDGATQRDIQRAGDLARQAAGLDPGSLEPLRLELRIRALLRQHTERLEVADRILGAAAGDPGASRAKVESLAALGRRDEALAAAERFAADHPDDVEAHRLVLIMLAGLEPTAASARMTEYAGGLLETRGDDPRFVLLAAQAYTQVGRSDEAREAALTLASGETAADLDAPALGATVQLLDILGMQREASALLDRLGSSRSADGSVAVIVVQRLFKQARIDDAAEAARAALASSPEPSAELVVWARLLGIEASLESARGVEDYHRAVVRGIEALMANAPADAALALETALMSRPADALTMHALAEAQDRLGAWIEANRLREFVLQSSPDFTTVRLALIESLLDRGEPRRAAQAARAGLRIDPSSGGLLLAFASSVADLDDADDAEIRVAVDIASSLDGPNTAEAPATPATAPLARLLIAQGRLPAAETAIARVVAAPGVADGRQLLALGSAAEGAGLDATGLYALIDKGAAIDATVLLDRAMELSGDGSPAEADALFARAAEGASGDAERLHRIMLARAAFMDRVGHPGALGELARLAESASSDILAQTLVLESSAAWSDEQLVTATIARMRRIVGEGGSVWRSHEARRLLVFGGSQADAAGAVALLEPMMTGQSVDPAAAAILADAYRVLGDTGAAVAQLERAVDAGLTSPEILLRVVWLHQSRGDIESARRRARALAGIEPVSAMVRRQRAATLIDLGLSDEASRDASVLAGQDTARDLAVAASIAARTDDTDLLETCLGRIESTGAMPIDVLTAVGVLMVESDMVARAFGLVASNRPASDTAEFASAEAAVLMAAGQREKAGARLRDALALGGDPGHAAQLVRLLAAEGDDEEARRLATEYAGRSAELEVLARALELGAPELTAGSDPRAADRTIAAVRAHTLDGGSDEALMNELRAVTSEYPAFFPAWAIVADRLRGQGRVEEAAETALTAARLNPSDPRPARLATEILVGLEPATRALAAAADWQRRSRPDTYEADTATAAILTRMGRHADAASLLSRWGERITRDSAAPPVLVRLLAASMAVSGRVDEARELFLRRAQRDVRWTEHEIELARDLIRYFGAPDLARQWLDATGDERTGSPGDALRMGQARLELSRLTGSLSDGEAALAAAQRAGTQGDASTALGADLIRLQALVHLGRAHEALTLAQRVASEHGNDPLALSAASDAMLLSREAGAEALGLAERAADLVDRTPAASGLTAWVTDVLGRAQLAAGRAEEAEQTLRRAIALDRRAPLPRLGLAGALLEQGKPDEARRVLTDPSLRESLTQHGVLVARHAELAAAAGTR
jgi:tetratricopeptide (TPR) repeat protein